VRGAAVTICVIARIIRLILCRRVDRTLTDRDSLMYLPQSRTFLPPEDENATIWRYMDFTKFCVTDRLQVLHFTRPDQFADPFEGAVPQQARLNLQESAQRLNYPPTFNPLAPYEQIRRLTCVNCWHVNEHESEAMWKLYLKSDEGIAIRSTHSRLIQSFDDSKDVAICVGMVQYIDYGVNRSMMEIYLQG